MSNHSIKKQGLSRKGSNHTEIKDYSHNWYDFTLDTTFKDTQEIRQE